MKKIFSILFILLVFCSNLQAQEEIRIKRPLLWLVDASNSMWGRVDGSMKIKLAAKAITDFMKSNDSYHFGLMVFGHRKIDDCYDIELLYPPDGEHQNEISQFLQKVRPLGKTPLEESLNRAGEIMKNYPNGYIILVSDGKEACFGDPCRAAKRLKERDLILGSYVIGYTESIDERPDLKCIVEETGGRYFTISKINELNQYLAGDTIIVNNAYNGPLGDIGYRCFLEGKQGIPAYGTSVILKDQSGTTLRTSNYWRGILKNVPATKLTLTAINGDSVISKDIEVLPDKINLIVFSFSFQTGTIQYKNWIDGLEEGRAYGTVTQIIHHSGEMVYSGTQWEGQMSELPVGNYIVKADNSGQSFEREVTVKPNKTELTEFFFKLGKGRIGYRCYLDSTKQNAANGTVLTFFRNPYQEEVLKTTGWRGNTTFLPEGEYVVEGDYQGIAKRVIINIHNDSTSNVDLVFNLKNVTLAYRCFIENRNMPATGVEVQVLNVAGDVIKQGSGWRGTFVIPEGKYILRAIYKGISKSVDFELNAVAATHFEKVIFFDQVNSQ